MAWIGAIAGIAGSLLGSDASEDAANTQAESAREASRVQKEMFDIAREDNRFTRELGDDSRNMLAMLMGVRPMARRPAAPVAPAAAPAPAPVSVVGSQNASQWTPGTISMGEDGSPGYWLNGTMVPGMAPAQPTTETPQNALMPQQTAAPTTAGYDESNPLFGSLTKKFTYADLPNDPGYQWQLQEGVKARDMSAAARGNLYSGAQQKALTRWGQGLAATTFNDAFNRNQTQNDSLFNKYASLAGAGQVATNNINSLGAQYANNVGNNMMAGANAEAAGRVGSANAINQGIGTWLNYNQNQNYLKMLRQQPTAGGGYGSTGGYTYGGGALYEGP